MLGSITVKRAVDAVFLVRCMNLSWMWAYEAYVQALLGVFPGVSRSPFSSVACTVSHRGFEAKPWRPHPALPYRTEALFSSLSEHPLADSHKWQPRRLTQDVEEDRFRGGVRWDLSSRAPWMRSRVPFLPWQAMAVSVHGSRQSPAHSRGADSVFRCTSSRHTVPLSKKVRSPGSVLPFQKLQAASLRRLRRDWWPDGPTRLL